MSFFIFNFLFRNNYGFQEVADKCTGRCFATPLPHCSPVLSCLCNDNTRKLILIQSIQLILIPPVTHMCMHFCTVLSHVQLQVTITTVKIQICASPQVPSHCAFATTNLVSVFMTLCQECYFWG